MNAQNGWIVKGRVYAAAVGVLSFLAFGAVGFFVGMLIIAMANAAQYYCGDGNRS